MNRCRPFSEYLKLRNTLVNQHVQAIDNKPALRRLSGHLLNESCDQRPISQLLSVSVDGLRKRKDYSTSINVPPVLLRSQCSGISKSIGLFGSIPSAGMQDTTTAGWFRLEGQGVSNVGRTDNNVVSESGIESWL